MHPIIVISTRRLIFRILWLWTGIRPPLRLLCSTKSLQIHVWVIKDCHQGHRRFWPMDRDKLHNTYVCTYVHETVTPAVHELCSEHLVSFYEDDILHFFFVSMLMSTKEFNTNSLDGRSYLLVAKLFSMKTTCRLSSQECLRTLWLGMNSRMIPKAKSTTPSSGFSQVS
jgi:hypothetical protein